MRAFSSSLLAFVLLATRAASSSVELASDAPSLSFFAPIVDGGETWTFGTAGATSLECDGVASTAVTHTAGAGLEFEFVGTAMSLVTSPSSAYSISIDGREPLLVHGSAHTKRGFASRPSRPSGALTTRAPTCGVTFASETLAPGTHTARIVAGPAADGNVDLAFVRAVINGNVPQPIAHAPSANQPGSAQFAQEDQTPLATVEHKPESNAAVIAVGVTIGLLLVLIPVALILFRKWRRRQSTPGRADSLDLEKPPVMSEQSTRQQHTSSWFVRSHLKPLKLADETPVAAAAPAVLQKPRPPFRGRRQSAVRSSWTSFAAGSPGGLEKEQVGPRVGTGIGKGHFRVANETASVGSLNDTLTLLRPPVPPKKERERRPRHPFRVPTLHPTRPKVGCPTLRVQT